MLLTASNDIKLFELEKIKLSKYLFFTGKGGAGKTSLACAIAVALADSGKRVLLVSTDPASNLQDVFGIELDGKGVVIPEVTSLKVANLDPEKAAREYRDSVITPYRGKLPESVIANMEEQLSGSCTVEIAAFDQFSKFITDDEAVNSFDHIIFDTAPTGHTLRMLQLPSAWTQFISENTHGASCLGQLSGLQEKKTLYKMAVENLSDPYKTTIMLVSKPERLSLLEANRTSAELSSLNINNQLLIINGVLENDVKHDDELYQVLYQRQQKIMDLMLKEVKASSIYKVGLHSYNIIGINNVRSFFTKEQDDIFKMEDSHELTNVRNIQAVIDNIHASKKKVIFTMGKGGVGKTTVASIIAKGLAEKGVVVHLTTTDPANHLKYMEGFSDKIVVSNIDEKKELERYSEEVLTKARETMNENDIAYVEEDLRSPCTQEIAIFRAFAEIVDKATEQVVIIDTAPTGHTLLLLDTTLSYHKEVQRTKGEVPNSVKELLPRLRDRSFTEVLIVTLAEATPVFEASRLKDDLERAGIFNKWWVVNQSLLFSNTTNPLLQVRAQNEKRWIKSIIEISKNNCAVIPINRELL